MVLISLEDAKAEVRKVVSDFKTRYDINYRLNSLPSIELEDEAEQTEPKTQTETQNSNLTFEKDECAKEYEELGLKELKELIEADRKTESSSEIPNNCEHITEDGVTCAKYPACDDCLDNPLNKLKGSERLVKGSELTEPTISKMEQVDKDINVRSKDEEYINNLPWTEVGNGEQTDDAYFLKLMGAVERGEISDAGANQAWYEYINHKDEPQTDDFFREPTAEERKAVAEYIESISIPTGVNVFDLMDEPQTESLEQFRVGLEYHTDTTHFGKVKGESITTNKVEDEPQTETEIAKAIVHKMIDDAVIAEDAYPDLRQKMHDAVDEYEPQTKDWQDWKDRMWAEAIVTEPTTEDCSTVPTGYNLTPVEDEQTDCTEALTLLWIKNMVTDEEFYRIDARLKVMPQTERSE